MPSGRSNGEIRRDHEQTRKIFYLLDKAVRPVPRREAGGEIVRTKHEEGKGYSAEGATWDIEAR